ncbi:DNA replication licensing factor mcm5-A [Orchesella cincta]|uniref:DNA replication licensing factor MCM5 n=1 Tax=Orchesella cincta TaxID=48709 RepID=A0A1D2MFL1_ORCCI|nr:DNA replication licensing factor mcm5-A [Orchesella cincta]
MMAKHVMRVHMNAQRVNDQPEQEGELSLLFLKKYIAYCKAACGPRLTQDACDKLKNKYVLMRSGNKEAEESAAHRNPIPITVRQLEAVIRMAESLAKMQLKPFATDVHIDEALRLFQVSTLDAASSGNLAGVEGYTTQEDHELLNRIESQMKRRMAIGTQVSMHTVVQDFQRQKYDEKAIQKVIYTMIRRGELQHRLQRKMLYRIK